MLDLGVRMGPGDDLDPGIGGARPLRSIWPASKALGMARISRVPPAGWRRRRHRRWRHCRRWSRCPRPAAWPAACRHPRSPGTAGPPLSAPRRPGCRPGHSRPGSCDRRAWSAAAQPSSAFAPAPRSSGRRLRRRRRSSGSARFQPAAAAGRQPAKISGLSRIDRIAPARIRSRPCSGSRSERDAELGQDEGELADLRQARRDRQRGAERVAEGQHDDEARRPTCRRR